MKRRLEFTPIHLTLVANEDGAIVSRTFAETISITITEENGRQRTLNHASFAYILARIDSEPPI